MQSRLSAVLQHKVVTMNVQRVLLGNEQNTLPQCVVGRYRALARGQSWTLECVLDERTDTCEQKGDSFVCFATLRLILFGQEEWGVQPVLAVKEQVVRLGSFHYEERQRFYAYLHGWVVALSELAKSTFDATCFMPHDFVFPEVFKLRSPVVEGEFRSFLNKPKRLGKFAT